MGQNRQYEFEASSMVLGCVGFRRPRLRVVIGLIGVAAVAATMASSPAEARKRKAHSGGGYTPPYAAMVVDARTGRTLHAVNEDAARIPASLTKVMTLYMLFEQMERGRFSMDSELKVSSYAASQPPTKLGLRAGSTISVEDAIKSMITLSANDSSVVVAENIAGSEEAFADQMTRKARSLGMSSTRFYNPHGLPHSPPNLTTARDLTILARALQERFPKYYPLFSMRAFQYGSRTIRGHNRLLGKVEGVDGIKTGYTRASGFNLVSSMRRGNRQLIGVVLGGRSGGSRDAIMRNLLAENVEKAATVRTVAAITERSGSEAGTEVAEAPATSRPTESVRVNGTVASASAEPTLGAMQPSSARPGKTSLIAAAAAALPPPQAKPEPVRSEPAPLTSGVIQTQSIAAIPGSAEPMKPVKVKTVQVKAGGLKLASAAPSAVIANAQYEAPETSSAAAARTDARAEMPPQPANFGTGNGVLGVLPASRVAAPQALAAVQPAQSRAAQQSVPAKPAATVAHSGWIIQVGALESESEARQRIDLARSQSHGLLNKADPFTEVVAKDNRKLFRARFAGLERDQAEAVCRTLKRADISCITVRN